MDINRHNELSQMYLKSKLLVPNIQWHLSLSDIDLSLQGNQLHPKLLIGGLTLLPEVQIESIFNQMTNADAAMFRRRQLYSSSFDNWKISGVWDIWLNEQKLIPPTILVFNKEFAETLGDPLIIPTKYLRPVDGKHRINVACFFGIVTMPILVRTKQVEVVKRKLQL